MRDRVGAEPAEVGRQIRPVRANLVGQRRQQRRGQVDESAVDADFLECQRHRRLPGRVAPGCAASTAASTGSMAGKGAVSAVQPGWGMSLAVPPPDRTPGTSRTPRSTAVWEEAGARGPDGLPLGVRQAILMLLGGTRSVTDRLRTIATSDQQLMIWITRFSGVSGVVRLQSYKRLVRVMRILAGRQGALAHVVGCVVKVDTISRSDVDVHSTFTQQR